MNGAAKISPGEETKDGSAPGAATSGIPGAPPGAEPRDKKSVVKKDKNAFLKNARTEVYADDGSKYETRITFEQRVEFFHRLLEKKARKKPPKKHQTYQDTWMKGDYDYEADSYPGLLVLMLNILKSQGWDLLYLVLLLLYFVIIVAVYDGLSYSGGIPMGSTNTTIPGGLSGSLDAEATKNAAALGLTPVTMLLPVIFMIVTQIPPSLGIFYFINRCNDLVKYKAKFNFGNWAFSSIFIAQAVEQFWYSGRGREHAAGKCAYGERMMKFLGKKRIDLSALDNVHNLESESEDDDEDQWEDDLPQDYLSIEDRIRTAREYAERNPEDEEAQKLVEGELEVSFLQKMLNEKRELEEAAVAKRKANEEAREASCTDWTEWTCIVCNTTNRRPSQPVPISDVYFGERGVYYKRTFAIIRPRRDKPQCKFCNTYSDYDPPASSAHTFPYNRKPYKVFSNYPKEVRVQAGLKNTVMSRVYNAAYSCCYGLKNNSSSKMVENDWRLRLFLNGRFPETPRQIKPRDQLYKQGEWLECKLQKVDWARCQVVKVHSNHTYDLRYDGGDELRLVHEYDLRLPPEKRVYAYKVELAMVFIVFMMPVGILAGSLISSALYFFWAFLVGGFLAVIRISRLIFYFRKFYYAGLWPLFKTTMFFTLPLITLTFAGFLPMIGSTWLPVAYAWIATKVFSLPILYISKPHYAMFGAFLFIQTSAGFYMVAAYCDGAPVVEMMAVNMAPLITACLTMIHFRRSMTTYVDVSLTIRPPLNFIKPPPLLTRLYNLVTCTKDSEPDAAEMEKLEAGIKEE